jgi:adenylate cyclase class 2
MALEREVKLRFESAETARERVLALGATPLRGRRLQEDALLDTPDGQLRSQRSALRVRCERGHSLLTFKGPPHPGPMKLRDEIETMVGDGGLAMAILQALGYTVCFRYEKYREEFAFEDVVVAIDETPIGVFVEIEGPADHIVTTARGLGYTETHFIAESYRTLFVAHQEAMGLPGRDMVFPDHDEA